MYVSVKGYVNLELDENHFQGLDNSAGNYLFLYFLKVPLFNFNTWLQIFHITLENSCKLPPYWYGITSSHLMKQKGLAFSY